MAVKEKTVFWTTPEVMCVEFLVVSIMVQYPWSFKQTAHHICFGRTILHHRLFASEILRQSRRLAF